MASMFIYGGVRVRRRRLGYVSSYAPSARTPMDRLIADTNPTIEARVLEHLEREDRGVRGEVSREDRWHQLYKPFITIEPEVRRHHLSASLDVPSTALLLLLLIACVVLWVLPHFMSYPPKTLVAISPHFGWACLGVAAGILVYFGRRSRTYVRRRFGSFLIQSLAELEPTADELNGALKSLRDADVLAARKTNRRWLHAELVIATRPTE